MRLLGKRAVVTGSGSHGVGRAIAMRFAREGADVIVHGHAIAEKTEELSAEIRGLGRRSVAFDADFSKPTAARGFMRAAVEAMGGIDILVHAAAAITRKPFLQLKDEEFGRVQRVNVHGTFACTQEAARAMSLQATGGRIIIISSINQQKVIRGQAHYCASKGAIMQLAKAMAVELAPERITVNLIAPGTVLTDFNRLIMADNSVRERFETDIPMGRIGQPEDYAGAAVYLASDEADFTTGASIFIDGGRSLI